MPAVYHALLELEKALGADEPITIEVKKIVIEHLAELHLLDTDDGADLLSLFASEYPQ